MITCASCQTNNPEDARFCKTCGNQLILSCSNCGHENLADARFCNQCGQSLQAESPRPPAKDPLLPQELEAKLQSVRSERTMVGERRIVSILFCDVKGSTAAAEQLDPEEWTEIMNGAFEHMIRPVYKYEGTVGRLMGDAVLAFFGAPIAHEDDPQRAVLAGLDIIKEIPTYRQQVKREWGVDFDVRVGINTGLVVVGEVGSDLKMEYTAMGDAINLAARMEQTAQPGTMQISAETYRLVSPYFEIKPLGKIEVKGKSEPIQTYQPLRMKQVSGSLRGIEGLEAPMIGRNAELETFRHAVDELAKGIGKILFVTGEAGIGKSRLLREMKNYVSDSQDILWLETQSLSYESGQPYSLIQRQVHQLLQTKPGLEAEALRNRIHAYLDTLGLQGQEKRAFEALFGLPSPDGKPPVSGEAFKGLLYTAMSHLWHVVSDQTPAVIVCDDVHWTDPASIALLQHLLLLVKSSPLLPVFVLRPERENPAWELLQQAENDFPHLFTNLNLHALTNDESKALIDNLLRISDLPEILREKIQEKTQGNPLFVEEVVRTLIDSGMVVQDETGRRWRATGTNNDIKLPNNLQTLLVARIDRLAGEEKQTLQIASVIGRTFYHRILIRLVDAEAKDLDKHLDKLQQAQFILEIARRPDREYTFRHVLTQEAAYTTLLLKQRRRFHRQVAEALEVLFADQIGSLAGTLAHHFNRARMFDKALHYFRRAGDTAFSLHASAEAIAYYQMALAAGEKTNIKSEDLIHLYTRLGRSFELNGQFTEAHQLYEQEMLSRAAESGDKHLELAAQTGLLIIYAQQSIFFNPAKAQALAPRVTDLAQRLENPAAESKILWVRLMMETFGGGDAHKGLEYGTRSLELARQHNLIEQMGFTYTNLVHANWHLDRVREAIESNLLAAEIWEELGNLPMQLDSYMQTMFINRVTGNIAENESVIEEGVEISRSIGNRWFEIVAYNNEVFLNIEQGQIDQAEARMQWLEKSVRESADLARLFSPTQAVIYRLLIQLRLGLREGVNEHLQHILENMGEIFPIWHPSFIGLAIMGQVFSGQIEEARQEWNEARNRLKIAETNNVYTMPFYSVEPLLKYKEGDLHSALELSQKLTLGWRKQGLLYHVPEQLELQARILSDLQKYDQGETALLDGLSVSEQIGERNIRWRLLSALVDTSTQLGKTQIAEEFREYGAEVVHFIGATLDDNRRSAFYNQPNILKLIQ